MAEGVPTVVSPAIEWMPYASKADPDDPCKIAEVVYRVLNTSGADARKRLTDYNAHSVRVWVDWLKKTRPAVARREVPCKFLGEQQGQKGGRALFACDKGHGQVRTCVECQTCDDYLVD